MGVQNQKMQVKPKALDLQSLSYAQAVRGRPAQTLIRVLENATGRRRVLPRVAALQKDVAAGSGVFDAAAARFGLDLEVRKGSIENIPQEGPVIVVANHPYGILDGLMLGHILAARRDRFHILAHEVFDQSPDLTEYLLPVSFDETRAGIAQNLTTRRTCLAALAKGGAIGVFPGGTVSTGRHLFARPMDPLWRPFIARLVAKSRAVVVPVFFHGHNSRLFQMVSHLNPALRLGLLTRECRLRLDRPIEISIGAPLGRDVLDPLAKDSKAMMDFLRKATYDLGDKPGGPHPLGLEFDPRYKAQQHHGDRHL